MCTVTWVATATGYELFVNRDERRGRGRAHPPRRFDDSTARYLAPVDADAGGTWTAVNEHGLSIALLNFYDAPNPPELADPQSRGLLIPRLIGSADAEQAAEGLQAVDLIRFRPFTLMLLSPVKTSHRDHGNEGPIGRVFDWDGRELARRDEDGSIPLCSSGHDTARARQVRRRLFAALTEPGQAPRPDHLLEFHRSHLPLRGAESPCMHRPEARTVSMTRIIVDGPSVSMRYADGPPCRNAIGEALILSEGIDSQPAGG